MDWFTCVVDYPLDLVGPFALEIADNKITMTFSEYIQMGKLNLLANLQDLYINIKNIDVQGVSI